MMKILAIVGSYRKGKTIDTLVDRAIAGAESHPGVQVDKIVLMDNEVIDLSQQHSPRPRVKASKDRPGSTQNNISHN